MTFFLGTHYPAWVANPTFAAVPLFVSARRLRRKGNWPSAATSWALDSGGFSELQLYGEWVTPAMQYSSEVRRWRDEIGGMTWAAIQDWMCEDIVIKGGVTKKGIVFKGTGLSIREHQRQTIASWNLLRQLAPDIPWLPVLQGKHPDDYLAHVEQYKRAGTDLTKVPLVGVGSVCRRQRTAEVLAVLSPLKALGLRLHGFGVKVTGLELGAAALLDSADSMAWSYAARNSPRSDGCGHVFGKGKSKGEPSSCANCPAFARNWYDRVLCSIDVGRRVWRPQLFA